MDPALLRRSVHGLDLGVSNLRPPEIGPGIQRDKFQAFALGVALGGSAVTAADYEAIHALISGG